LGFLKAFENAEVTYVTVFVYGALLYGFFYSTSRLGYMQAVVELAIR
jgi:hypothetical protein